jgi:putative drug exporter of the RND superfamily
MMTEVEWPGGGDPGTRAPLYRLGVVLARRRRMVFAAWGAAVVVSLLLLPGLLARTGLPNIDGDASQSSQAAQVLQADVPLMGQEQMLLVFHSRRLIATSRTYLAAMEAGIAGLARQPGIVSAWWFPFAASRPGPDSTQQVGLMYIRGLPYHDPHNAYVAIGADGNDQQLITRFPAQRAAVTRAVERRSAGLVQAYFIGRTPVAYDLRSTQFADLRVSEAIAVLGAFILLLLGMGRLGSAIVPMLSAGTGILLTLGLFALVSRVLEFDVILISVSTAIGLAMGIDYALLILSRYREELRTGASREHAVATAVASAGRTVIGSGLIIILASSGLLLVRIPTFIEFAVATGVAIIAALLTAITLLPAVLVWWTPRLEFGVLPGRSDDRPEDEGVWARWVRYMLRHPWPYLLGALAVLLVVAAPVLSLRTDNQVLRQVPAGSASAKATAILDADSFSGGDGPIELVVRRAAATPVPDIGPLISALRADTDVAAVGFLTGTTTSDVFVYPRQPPDSPASLDLVRYIRDDIVPHAAPSGHEVLVGGIPALLLDDYTDVTGNFWWVVGYVLAISFLGLAVIFRSLVVPLKAVAASAVTTAAGFGGLVAVFQWGYGKTLLHLPFTGPVLVYIPLLVLAMTFAMATDYEVFLVRRIQESYQATHDNDHAIAVGLQRTARPILLAAAIMVAVFLALLNSPVMEVRQFGLGLATAIAIDATLIRLVVVPAMMKLLGPWNWWLPRPLGRLLRARPSAGVRNALRTPAPADPGSPERRQPLGPESPGTTQFPL